MSLPFRALEEACAYSFVSHDQLIQALTHKSHYHENHDAFYNERLEFLGDAILSLCVSEILMQKAPEADEGQLSKLRAQIVCESSLAQAARSIQLGSYLRLGKGEEMGGGREREALLADSLEALLAAIYLEGGLEAARRTLLQWMPFLSDGNPEIWSQNTSEIFRLDYKSRFQELCQKHALGTPRYVCLNAKEDQTEGPFTMALFLKDLEIGRFEASTKKEATQKIAQNLLSQGEEELLAKLHQSLREHKNSEPMISEGV